MWAPLLPSACMPVPLRALFEVPQGAENSGGNEYALCVFLLLFVRSAFCILCAECVIFAALPLKSSPAPTQNAACTLQWVAFK